MRIINDSTPAAHVRPSMFLHGLTGNGKSFWSETGGTPLAILTEPKAASMLRLINPKAVGMVPESLDDLEFLLEFLGRPEGLAKQGIDRIVLDSYTELTLAIPRWIKARAGQGGQVLTKLELHQYGDLRDFALAVVKAIQLTGYPSIILGRSVSKKVGLAESIRPDGLGKSIEELPGKLLPTAEARFDPELGYVIDTTPAEHSQRCGLPWLPQVFSGTCLDYLALIEGGPQGVVPVPAAPAPEAPKPKAKAAPKPAPEAPPAPPPAAPAINPPSSDVAWTNAIVEFNNATHKAGMSAEARAAAFKDWESKGPGALPELLDAINRITAGATPDPEKDPEGYKRAFGAMCLEMEQEKRAKAKAATATPATEDFVNDVAPAAAQREDITELLDLCQAHKVNIHSMWDYAVSRKQAIPARDGSLNWFTLTAEFCTRIVPQLKDAEKRPTFISWLHKTHIPF